MFRLGGIEFATMVLAAEYLWAKGHQTELTDRQRKASEDVEEMCKTAGDAFVSRQALAVLLVATAPVRVKIPFLGGE